ncbi:MAG: serine/threonine protein kinase [Bacteroidales bacterium]|nr:serine/threonine protein kinase [Bacteroidales bacterium]
MDNNDISSSGFVIQENNSETNSSYHSIKEIETKGYSCLYTATKFGKKVILKGLKPEFKKERFYQDLLKKEFEISYFLDHPNIVKIIDFQNISNIGDCIVMEYVEGVTLREFIESQRDNKTTSRDVTHYTDENKHDVIGASSKVARSRGRRDKRVYEKIFNELLDAMEYFHSKQIIHRDLKPDNILITNNGNNVKIIDFGLSDADDYVILKQAAGTRKYAAPEQLIPNNTIDCKADIYSLGIILKNNFPKSYHKIAEKCAQQDKEKRFSSVGEIRNFIKKKKITKITATFSLILLLLFALSFVVTKHYISSGTYSLNEEKILTESTQYIDSQIEIIKNKIKEGPTSSLDKYNEVVKIYYELTTLDHKKWLDNIPNDIPFYNDFMTHWNTYFGENHKDVIMSYIYWNQESVQLIFDNLKPGENIVADEEIPVMFRIIKN